MEQLAAGFTASLENALPMCTVQRSHEEQPNHQLYNNQNSKTKSPNANDIGASGSELEVKNHGEKSPELSGLARPSSARSLFPWSGNATQNWLLKDWT